MTTTLKTTYGSSGQAITVTLASLTTGSARASAVVDNATNKFLDALVQIAIKTGGSGTAATGYVNIYAYGTANGGTDYGENATGSDAAITLVSPTNLRLLGTLNCVSNSTTYKSNPMSVASAFRGSMPEKWGIIIENQTGGTLDGTEGSHLKVYQGLQQEAA